MNYTLGFKHAQYHCTHYLFLCSLWTDQEEADDDGAEEEADDSGVTPKSIFQIQYFNVVLWTAVGLTAMLFVAIGMTISMPLEPDTLLFGESAKIVGE